MRRLLIVLFLAQLPFAAAHAAQSDRSFWAGPFLCSFKSAAITKVVKYCTGSIANDGSSGSGACEACGYGGSTPECYIGNGSWQETSDGPRSYKNVPTFDRSGVSCSLRLPHGVKVLSVDCPVTRQAKAIGSESCKICIQQEGKRRCFSGWGGVGESGAPDKAASNN